MRQIPANPPVLNQTKTSRMQATFRTGQIPANPPVLNQTGGDVSRSSERESCQIPANPPVLNQTEELTMNAATLKSNSGESAGTESDTARQGQEVHHVQVKFRRIRRY